uniref:Uncharacterized protein n=1 Tax=Haptolina brevifila TaxID=156173 RepID=A0A7S2IXN3_9EUKA
MVANYAAPLAGQKRSATAVLPFVHCVPLPVEPHAVPEPQATAHVAALAEAERRTAASEEEARAAKAHAAEVDAQLKRVLRAVSDRMVAESRRAPPAQRSSMGGVVVMADRLERHTGLSREELRPYSRAMDLAFMALPPGRSNEEWFERIEGFFED